MPALATVARFILLFIASIWLVEAAAAPPSHAPAHGWRKKHDPYYVGYSGTKWERDYGIIAGRCNHEELATVLGGIVGGTVGSRVNTENRTVAILLGTIAGGIIGNRIGHALDAADESCIAHALEVGEAGHTITWRNETANIDYSLSLREPNEGRCRGFALFEVDTKQRKRLLREGTACHSNVGVWNVQDP
jgi:surface antigen